MLGLTREQMFFDEARCVAWWAKDLPDLPDAMLLIYAIQLLPATRGSLVPLVVDQSLMPSSNAEVRSFCTERQPARITLGHLHFRRVLSVKPHADYRSRMGKVCGQW